jgi:hypothetical protein
MLCKKNYKIVIIMKFLFHQSNVPKMFMVDALLKYWIFIRAVETNTYYVFFFLM